MELLDTMLPTIEVTCGCSTCPTVGVRRRVQLTTVASGLVEWPALRCVACGCIPKMIRDWRFPASHEPEESPVPKIHRHRAPTSKTATGVHPRVVRLADRLPVSVEESVPAVDGTVTESVPEVREVADAIDGNGATDATEVTTEAVESVPELDVSPPAEPAARQVEPELEVVLVADEPAPPPAPAGQPEVDSATVRAWAVAHGIDVAPRGRIPRVVIDMYLAAQENNYATGL